MSNDSDSYGDRYDALSLIKADRDFDGLIDGRGRMAGDVSDIDWVEWVRSKLFYSRTKNSVAVDAAEELENVYPIRICDLR